MEIVLREQAGHLVHAEGLTVECPRAISMHRGTLAVRELGPAEAWACFSRRVRELWAREQGACGGRLWDLCFTFYLLSGMGPEYKGFYFWNG